jgi:anaerobic selenocysteine-containing dehydrogenase
MREDGPHPADARTQRRDEQSTGEQFVTVEDAMSIVHQSHGRLHPAYALNDRYRGIHNGRRVVLVNPADIEALGLADRQLVDLVGAWEDGIERPAKDFRVVAYPSARGSAAS